MFPEEAEEFINVSDLVLAGPVGPVKQLLEYCVSPWDNTSEFGLYQQAKFLRHVLKFDPLAGLTNARIEPLPHQVSIVRTIIQKQQARMILADEVGLGKTIEAALILKELQARGLVERALIVCPASLQMQWQSELFTKFNLKFEIFDRDAIRHFGRGEINPFSQKNFVICSLPFASKDSRAEQIVEAGWDFVAFDEAHRVRKWRPTSSTIKVTKAYELAESLEPHTPALLMLTATPMQLSDYELYSLIQIVEPGIFRSYAAYHKKRQQVPELNELMLSLTGWNAIFDEEERRRIVTQLQTFIQDNELDVLDLDRSDRREDLIDELVKMHPLAGALVRNRKSEIGGFMGREAVQHGIEMREEERQLYADIESYIRDTFSWASKDGNKAIGFIMVTFFKMLASSPAAVLDSFGRRIEKLKERLRASEARKAIPFDEETLRDLGDDADFSEVLSAFEVEYLERDIAELEVLHGRLANVDFIDSKLNEFLEVVENIRTTEPETKIVIFTGFKATQKYLADNLGSQGISVSKFHGGLSLEEKEWAIREFRDSSQILISTEAGGEGRNLQFASVLINYDLPWNPMKVEQRIGRLDRFGQKKRVRILNLFRYETIEERVHAVLNDRIRLFEESVGSLEPILGDIETEIENLFMTGDYQDMATLEQAIEVQIAEALESDRLMTDLALDKSSFRRDKANDILGEEPLATQNDLRLFVSDVLEHFGGTLQEHEDGGEVISLSSKLSIQLELPSKPQQGVFDPQEALEREDLDFFALGNRWVDSIVEYAGVKAQISPVSVYSVAGGPALPQLEIIYEFRSSGRNPRGEVFVHRVGQELEVTDSLLKKMPVFGEYVRLECPDWLEEAENKSRARMSEQFLVFTEEVRKADEALREEDLERNERIAAYRRQRFIERIKDHEDWINQVEISGSDGQKKILPARKGRLKKDKDNLKKIDTESERERQKILSQASVPSATTWSAALVVGQ